MFEFINHLSAILVIVMPIVVLACREKIKIFFSEESKERIIEYQHQFNSAIEEFKSIENMKFENQKLAYNKEMTLTDDQKLCIEVTVLFFSNPFKKNNLNNFNIENRIVFFLSKRDVGEANICSLYESPYFWYTNKILNSTTSSAVNKVCLELRLFSYAKIDERLNETQESEHYFFCLLSLLYKELILDFKKIVVDDDFIMKYTSKDYFEYEIDFNNTISTIKKNIQI